MCGTPTHQVDPRSLTATPTEPHEIGEALADLRLQLQTVCASARSLLEALDGDGGPLRGIEERTRLAVVLGKVSRG